MDKLIKSKLNNVVRNEAKQLLENKDLENRLDDLDDLYILRRILDDYEELEPIVRKFFIEKDKKKKESEKERG